MAMALCIRGVIHSNEAGEPRTATPPRPRPLERNNQCPGAQPETPRHCDSNRDSGLSGGRRTGAHAHFDAFFTPFVYKLPFTLGTGI